MLRSVAYSCLPFTNTQCVSSRTRSVFHRGRRASFTAPGGFSVLETERTREVTPAVPGTECHSSRRGLFPFWKRSGRGRVCLPFCGLLRSVDFCAHGMSAFRGLAYINILNLPEKRSVCAWFCGKTEGRDAFVRLRRLETEWERNVRHRRPHSAVRWILFLMTRNLGGENEKPLRRYGARLGFGWNR